MKYLRLHPRLFAFISLGFVLATIIGTVSHELAHYTAMKLQGFQPTLHYDSAYFNIETLPEVIKYDSIRNADKDKIAADKNSPERKRLLAYGSVVTRTIQEKSFPCIVAGPVQTMLTGTMGVLVLWFRRKKIAETGMKAADWFWVIIAYFWSRQLCNFLVGLTIFFRKGRWGRGDEINISRYLNLPLYTVNLLTGLTGAVVLAWVTFFIIPKAQRFNFIIAGLAGSALGWMVWMHWIGPVVLPK